MADNYSARQQQPIQKKENNTGLPDNLKTGMENLSGMSLDDVKVHRNSDKPAQLQAHAYAQGTDIHLGSGQEKHLPHEAWHVVQQKQGRVKPTMQMKGNVNVNDDAGLEKEADVMGSKALQMKGETEKPFYSSKNLSSIVQGVFNGEIEKRNATQIMNTLKGQGFSLTFKEGRTLENSKTVFSTLDQIKEHLSNDKQVLNLVDSTDKVPSKKLEIQEDQVEENEEHKEKPLDKAIQHEHALDEFQVETKKEKEEEKEEVEKQVKISPGAQLILDQYNEGGLLVHTIQVENAKYEADNLIVSLENALHNQDQQITGEPAKEGQKPGHSGKRNWSLIHEEITCNPYDMGDDGKRFMGVLAQMKDVSNKYLKIYLADASSNSRIQEKQAILEEKEALSQIGGVLKELKQKELKGDNNNNSEIQTLGMDPNALGGLLFHKVKFNRFKETVQPQSWEEAKPLFQNAINEMASRGGRTSYYIFTYGNELESKSGKSKLIYIQEMEAQTE